MKGLMHNATDSNFVQAISVNYVELKKEYYPLGCTSNTMQPGKSLSIFWRNVLSQSSQLKHKPSKQPASNKKQAEHFVSCLLGLCFK
jgi:hypothetical protein